MGIGELMVIVVLPVIGFWLWTLVEVITYERDQQRVIWTIVVVLGGLIGASIYTFVRRPKRIARRR